VKSGYSAESTSVERKKNPHSNCNEACLKLFMTIFLVTFGKVVIGIGHDDISSKIFS
jgi:hypothetical protein